MRSGVRRRVTGGGFIGPQFARRCKPPWALLVGTPNGDTKKSVGAQVWRKHFASVSPQPKLLLSWGGSPPGESNPKTTWKVGMSGDSLSPLGPTVGEEAYLRKTQDIPSLKTRWRVLVQLGLERDLIPQIFGPDVPLKFLTNERVSEKFLIWLLESDEATAFRPLLECSGHAKTENGMGEAWQCSNTNDGKSSRRKSSRRSHASNSISGQNQYDFWTKERALVKVFRFFLQSKYKKCLIQFHELRSVCDFRSPAAFYKERGKKPRKIFLHFGPTNSGKSYEAVRRLVKSEKNGVYCAPLRLLAWEKYEELGVMLAEDCEKKTRLELRTGQEVKWKFFESPADRESHPSSPADRVLVSCTTEMCPFVVAGAAEKEIGVCVLDEAQLLCDDDRGGAWTRILLGMPCEELHLCGISHDSSHFENLLKTVLEEQCGDVIVSVNKSYQRFSPLLVESYPLVSVCGESNLGYERTLGKRTLGEEANERIPGNVLKTGDAFICFSRLEIFRLKEEIERTLLADSAGGSRACTVKIVVVYGSLPPEVRRQQAKLFNETIARGDRAILIASDCVGLGLNLNIKRIVFKSLEKFDGEVRRPLTAFEVKQIAGRAGRGKDNCGYVTSLHSQEDLETLREMLEEDPAREDASHDPQEVSSYNGNFAITPTVEQVEEFAEKFFAGHDDGEWSDIFGNCNSVEGARLLGGKTRDTDEVVDTVSFSTMLGSFQDFLRINSSAFKIQNLEAVFVARSVLDDVANMGIRDKYIFSQAPVDGAGVGGKKETRKNASAETSSSETSCHGAEIPSAESSKTARKVEEPQQEDKIASKGGGEGFTNAEGDSMKKQKPLEHLGQSVNTVNMSLSALRNFAIQFGSFGKVEFPESYRLGSRPLTSDPCEDKVAAGATERSTSMEKAGATGEGTDGLNEVVAKEEDEGAVAQRLVDNVSSVSDVFLLEQYYKIADLYVWLANHYSESIFTEVEEAEKTKRLIARVVQSCLEKRLEIDESEAVDYDADSSSSSTSRKSVYHEA